MEETRLDWPFQQPAFQRQGAPSSPQGKDMNMQTVRSFRSGKDFFSFFAWISKSEKSKKNQTFILFF